jgi:hypothetical protein
MSSSNDTFQPRHREHNDQERLPASGKERFDYSPNAIERAKLPKSEEGESQFRTSGGSECNCKRAGSGLNHDHEEHCRSKLHSKEPVAHQKIPTAEGHHFFDEENPRPKPVGDNGA